MARCFVIQPFDKGAFDKRYQDVFDPATRKANLEPYRVDQDPSVTILIETIEKEIHNSDICFAEITSDNPNVWFELGFAIAAGKEVLLLCEKTKRKGRFPFDIQHRNIVEYATDSSSDYDKLAIQITERLNAMVSNQRNLALLASVSPLRQTEGLTADEMIGLAVIMQNRLSPDAVVSAYKVQEDMKKARYTDIGISLTLESLFRKGMTEPAAGENWDGSEYDGYKITERGIQWLLKNKDMLQLRYPEPQPEKPLDVSDDEIPF